MELAQVLDPNSSTFLFKKVQKKGKSSARF